MLPAQVPIAGGARVGENAVRGLGIVSHHAVADRCPGRDAGALGNPAILTKYPVADIERLLGLVGRDHQPVVIAHAYALPAFALSSLCAAAVALTHFPFRSY